MRWTPETTTKAIYLAGKGLDLAEIGDIIGVSRGSVKKKLYRLGVSIRRDRYTDGRIIPIHVSRLMGARLYGAARKRGITTIEVAERILRHVCEDRLIDGVLDDL